MRCTLDCGAIFHMTGGRHRTDCPAYIPNCPTCGSPAPYPEASCTDVFHTATVTAPIRAVTVKDVIYLRAEDVAAYIRLIAYAEETDVRSRLIQAARNLIGHLMPTLAARVRLLAPATRTQILTLAQIKGVASVTRRPPPLDGVDDERGLILELWENIEEQLRQTGLFETIEIVPWE